MNTPLEQVALALLVVGVTAFYSGRLSARLRKVELGQVQINVLLAGADGVSGYLKKLDSTRRRLDDHVASSHDAPPRLSKESEALVARISVQTARALCKYQETKQPRARVAPESENPDS